MNSGPIDASMLTAFSLLPILFFLVWAAVSLGLLIFLVVMVARFVKAHERIAKHLETISLNPPGEPKEKI